MIIIKRDNRSMLAEHESLAYVNFCLNDLIDFKK